MLEAATHYVLETIKPLLAPRISAEITDKVHSDSAGLVIAYQGDYWDALTFFDSDGMFTVVNFQFSTAMLTTDRVLWADPDFEIRIGTLAGALNRCQQDDEIQGLLAQYSIGSLTKLPA